jgi:hypothetical protein
LFNIIIDELLYSFTGKSIPPSITYYGPELVVDFDIPSGSTPGFGFELSYISSTFATIINISLP